MMAKAKGRPPGKVSIRRVPKSTKLPAQHWIVDWFDDNVDAEHPFGHRHQVQRETEGEALKLKAKVDLELRAGVHTPPSRGGNTVKDEAIRYLERCATKCQPEMLANYRSRVENRITGWLPGTTL